MTVKKKILLVSSAFYPEISPRSFRATELAKEFSRQGHDVSVITKYRDYNYIDFLKEFKVTFNMWSISKLPKVPYFKQKKLSYLSRVISRVVSLLFEYPAIEEMFKVRKMLTHESGYDLMISFAVPYPVHWGVAWARTTRHRIAEIWVADCGDPYMGDILDSFRKPFYFGFFEKNFSRKADFITIPVESAKPAYYEEFHNKIRIIPQGFNFDITEKGDEATFNSIPEFAYAGGFLRGIRDPGKLMNYLLKIDIPFKFYVFTDQPDIIEEYIEKLSGKLIVSGYIPREKLMKKLSSMDFLINFDNNTNLNIPSKLIDYAISNRPVLNINKDFRSEDIQDFLNRNYSRRMALPNPEQYHIRNVSRKFLEFK